MTEYPCAELDFLRVQPALQELVLQDEKDLQLILALHAVHNLNRRRGRWF